MTTINRIRLATIAGSIVLAAGCASKPVEPTLADAMRGHSEQAQRQSQAKKELARDWERGSELADDGRELVARGEKRIEDAEEAMERGLAEVERGNEQVVEGEELKARSERQFRDRFPDLSLEPANGER